MPPRPRTAAYVCPRCCLGRHPHRRAYTSAATHSSPTPPPPPPTGATKLTTRRLISLHGPDSPKFLQGIISNNLRPDTRTGLYAAFLAAHGKVLHDVFIYPTLGSNWYTSTQSGNAAADPGYIVEVDAEQVTNLMKHLKKHKLRSKFTLRALEEGELDVWSLWREKERWTQHGGMQVKEGVLGLTDCRAPGMGQRLLLASGSVAAGAVPDELEGVEQAPFSAYTIRRYLRGVPEGQGEIPRDDSLPMNYNFDIMSGIDFKKGCYIGQELTIRTHHTGVVRRRVLPVALYGPESGPPDALAYNGDGGAGTLADGQDIKRDDKRQRSVGKLIASVGNVGLGLCRLEQMSDLVVSGEGSTFNADDRFVVQHESERKAGIKAFVPDWMRGRIREPKIQKRVE